MLSEIFMTKNIDDYSFTELMNLVNKYINVYKNGSAADVVLFKKNHPEVFTERFHEIIGEFLNAFGISDSLLDKIKNNINVNTLLNNTWVEKEPTVH